MKTKSAFIFPGQGSQSVGMLKELAGRHSIIFTTFSAASELLGYDLWDLVSNDRDNLLNQTQYTQPALLTVSVALWRCNEMAGIIDKPNYMAGHSLGEYSALVCAGALSFSDAVYLVHRRSVYMQKAVPTGNGVMIAVIGLTDEQVITICDKLSAESNATMEAANFNAPGQVVVAGNKSLSEQAQRLFKKAGARKVVELPVSVPSHCSLMKDAADCLASDLTNITFKQPDIPVLHNVTADICDDPNKISNLLQSQLISPVKWTDSIKKMVKANVKDMYECGPGKVLAGLSKRIDRSVSVHSMESGQYFS